MYGCNHGIKSHSPTTDKNKRTDSYAKRINTYTHHSVNGQQFCILYHNFHHCRLVLFYIGDVIQTASGYKSIYIPMKIYLHRDENKGTSKPLTKIINFEESTCIYQKKKRTLWRKYVLMQLLLINWFSLQKYKI
jgi:hypothetical protein